MGEFPASARLGLGAFAGSTVSTVSLRYRSLDAAARVAALRGDFVRRLGNAVDRPMPGAELIGIGIETIRTALVQRTPRSVLAVGTHTTLEVLQTFAAPYRRVISSGGRVEAIIDIDSASSEAIQWLLTADWLPTRACSAPLQLQIHDQRQVIIEGPDVDGQRTAFAVSHPQMISAALDYWRHVRAMSVSVLAITSASPLREFSERQRQVVHLMAGGLTDEAISRHLGLSVRTVRYEVNKIFGMLSARSRFEAGLRLGQLSLRDTDRGRVAI